MDVFCYGYHKQDKTITVCFTVTRLVGRNSVAHADLLSCAAIQGLTDAEVH